MKTIGLIGGTSWPSTIEYYRILNELTQEKLGGFHSANLLLYSIDYHEIKSRYYEGWNEIPTLLKSEIERLIKMGPDCIMIYNNTLHKAFDEIKDSLNLKISYFISLKLRLNMQQKIIIIVCFFYEQSSLWKMGFIKIH